ncbi:hypothetical protein GCM10009332_10580 [Shewanella gelidii]|uniref:Uncharacterized protein n=1 Tax=Shewanella gelidii TaxID=1642821 RepID=A0A917JM78_9GAMM|nr:hypothetical protein GCM10009332_10580 [Shewanella gelidii]
MNQKSNPTFDKLKICLRAVKFKTSLRVLELKMNHLNYGRSRALHLHAKTEAFYARDVESINIFSKD